MPRQLATATRRGAMSVSPGEEVSSAAISYSLVQSNVQGKPEQVSAENCPERN